MQINSTTIAAIEATDLSLFITAPPLYDVVGYYDFYFTIAYGGRIARHVTYPVKGEIFY
jgi:hypothetical protein